MSGWRATAACCRASSGLTARRQNGTMTRTAGEQGGCPALLLEPGLATRCAQLLCAGMHATEAPNMRGWLPTGRWGAGLHRPGAAAARATPLLSPAPHPTHAPSHRPWPAGGSSLWGATATTSRSGCASSGTCPSWTALRGGIRRRRCASRGLLGGVQLPCLPAGAQPLSGSRGTARGQHRRAWLQPGSILRHE